MEQAVADPMITIDGATHPEQIPDYQAWGYAMRLIGRMHVDKTGWPDELPFGAADTPKVLAEAEAYKETERQQCQVRQQAEWAEWDAIHLSTRERAARDRLMTTLSPEGAATDRRSTTTTNRDNHSLRARRWIGDSVLRRSASDA